MNTYITGPVIRKLREERQMTQAQLAQAIGVSDKAVSKWETGKGLPDISLIEPLASALGISIMELLNGEQIVNRNICGNVLRTKFYVCPICGNIFTSLGDAVLSCCGVSLPPLEAEKMDTDHTVTAEQVEDELFLTMEHPMTKTHYISFLAAVTSNRIQFIKLYPEGNPESRIKLRGHGILYAFCNKHGLFYKRY